MFFLEFPPLFHLHSKRHPKHQTVEKGAHPLFSRKIRNGKRFSPPSPVFPPCSMGSHTGTNVASVLGGTLGLLPPGGAFLRRRRRGVDTVCDSLCRGGRGRGIAYVTVCSFLLQQNSRSPSPFIQLPFPPPLSPPPPSVRPSVRPPFFPRSSKIALWPRYGNQQHCTPI